MEQILHVGFAFNFNLQYAFFDKDEEKKLVRDGEEPLLNRIQHHGIKANLFVGGYTGTRWSESFPDMIDKVKNGVKQGTFEIGTYTFSHPVMPLIPYEDTERQIRKGLEVDEKIWGLKPKGFLLPELAWDPILPKILGECGVEWIGTANTVHKDSDPRCKEEELFLPIELIGAEGTKITGVQTSYWFPLQKSSHVTMPYNVFNSLYQGTLSIESILRCIESVQAMNKRGDLLVLLKNDAEAIVAHPYFSGILTHEDSRQRLDAFLSKLKELPYVKLTTVSEYLENRKPVKTIFLKTMSGHSDISNWIKGSEKTHQIINEAREEIRAASYAVTLAEKMGADVTDARRTLEEAWTELLWAENSDGMTTAAFPPAYPHYVRILDDVNRAIRARRLAQESIGKIKFKRL